MPRSICNYPGCKERIPFRSKYCDTHRKEKQREYSSKDFNCREWQHLYKTQRWKALRENQLKKQPLCEECLRMGRVTLATVADHIEDHKGDVGKFFYGSLQSLCTSCHSKKTMKENNRKNGTISGEGGVKS